MKDKAKLKVDFSEMVEEIEQEQILLPDFQRGFKWTNKEMQGKLAASVLCKMPIGSVLLLDLPGKEYAARRIGSSEQDAPIVLETDEKREFLLDGQQRITVMVNLFSNLIHEGNGTRLDSLKRRAFLGIAKPTQKEKYENNWWGLKWLYFPLATPEKDIPKFLTEDIVDTIFLEDFTKSRPSPFSPYCEWDVDQLISYCISNDEYYFIPLYLLARRKDDRMQRRNRIVLQHIIEKIADGQVMRLEQEYDNLITEAEKKNWLKPLEEGDNVIQEIINNRQALTECLQSRKMVWVGDMESYLYSCVNSMNLHIMDVPNSSREKAIEIFENMNKGGVKLSTFDLVMARGARDNRHFRKELEKECGQDRSYPEGNIPDRIRKYCLDYIQQKRRGKGKYNALIDIKCIESNGEYSKVFQDAFLNVLSLKCHDVEACELEINNGAPQEQRNYREDMSREKILNLTSKEINANCKACCKALDNAAFFLKTRCGIRNITEVNYRLMYTVLSYLFLKEEIYEKKAVWNLLTAWYWCAIFSGSYNQDQNMQANRDIALLSKIIRENKDNGNYIKGLQERMWKASDFSDKDFLLYKRSQQTGNYPKEILGDYICQFYLAHGYNDILPDKNGRLTFLCTFTEENAEAIEKHHIVPKMSFQSIREENEWSKTKEGKCNVVNSPLNMVYISRGTNKKISSCDLPAYLKYVEQSCTYDLNFPVIYSQQAENGIADILGARLDALQSKMYSDVNYWMTEWR